MLITRSKPPLALFAGLLLAAVLAIHGPIAQSAAYHAFSDQRSLLGIAHAGDVLSNLGFLLAAAYGAWRLRHSTLAGAERSALAVFVAALGLTALGSAWYHLAPDDARLVWDRLPIALACGALLAAVLRSRLALLLLAACAFASVLWWRASGDLRPYLLLQAAPLILVPLLQWQHDAPAGQRRACGLAIALYVLAKLCEVADQAWFDVLGAVSGHTLKHLLAAAAAVVLVRALTPGSARPDRHD